MPTSLNAQYGFDISIEPMRRLNYINKQLVAYMMSFQRNKSAMTSPDKYLLLARYLKYLRNLPQVTICNGLMMAIF